MEDIDMESKAVDWFVSAIETPRLRCSGGYSGTYRILNEHLILNDPDFDGGRLRIWEISDVIEMYVKYREYTEDKGYADVSFKRQHDDKEDEFYEETYDREI